MTAPYSAGELSQESKDDALAMLNNVRYIAGLSADVIWDDTYEDLVQAGVLVNAVNRVMSHYPTQPDDMSDELYKLGYTGCGKSNLGKGYISLTNSLLIGWMADDDSDNIQSVGHRRWILNPSMGKTAFGKVGSYSGMYAIDRSNSAAQESAVAWPAQVMPLEYFSSSYPWSVTSLSVADTTVVKVVVRRESDGREWSFSESSKDGDFYVGSSYVVFRPDGISLSDGDIYQVQITGLEEEITYSVSFFRLDNYWNASADNANTTDTTDSTNTSQTLTNCKVASLTNKSGGIVVKWNQVEGASGYYVYRKVSGGKYTRIATITDATTVRYVDADVKNDNGTTYKYKVVPYSGSTKGTGTAKTIVRLTGTSFTSVKNSAAGKVRMKWTAVLGVTGYQIQYSTSSSFASYKTRKISGAASVSKTLSSLTNGKTYYVRIRTYKTVNGKTYYSAWSSKLKVKITK